MQSNYKLKNLLKFEMRKFIINTKLPKHELFFGNKTELVA